MDVDNFLAGRDGVRHVREADFLEVGRFVVYLAAGEDGVYEGCRDGGGAEGREEGERCEVHRGSWRTARLRTLMMIEMRSPGNRECAETAGKERALFHSRQEGRSNTYFISWAKLYPEIG